MQKRCLYSDFGFNDKNTLLHNWVFTEEGRDCLHYVMRKHGLLSIMPSSKHVIVEKEDRAPASSGDEGRAPVRKELPKAEVIMLIKILRNCFSYL